jgi:hypothetical protein
MKRVVSLEEFRRLLDAVHRGAQNSDGQGGHKSTAIVPCVSHGTFPACVRLAEIGWNRSAAAPMVSGRFRPLSAHRSPPRGRTGAQGRRWRPWQR